MIKTKTETREVEVIDAIVCDICEKEFNDVMETQEFVHFDYIGGYGSVFRDMSEIKLDICQYCFNEKLREFVLKRWDKEGEEDGSI